MKRHHFILMGIFTLAVGCGGSVDDDNGGAAGSAGSGGSGGSAGSGGVAGSGGSGGAAGAGATAGSGGSGGAAGAGATAGSGGSGGAAGAGATAGSGGDAGSAGTGGTAGAGGAPLGPQCTDESTCTIYSDCCSCVALPLGEPFESCPAMCAIDKCSELGIDLHKQPECQAGQCVVGFDCDGSTVVCAVSPPSCDAGEVPSVAGSCWGPCVPADECSFVPDCSDCDNATQVCVSNVAWTVDNHCVPIPEVCDNDVSCACLGEAVCSTPSYVCIDAPDDVISCECTNC